MKMSKIRYFSPINHLHSSASTLADNHSRPGRKRSRAAPSNDQSTIDRSTSPKSVAGSARAALRQLKTFRFRFTKGNQLLRPLQFKRREIDAQEIAPAG